MGAGWQVVGGEGGVGERGGGCAEAGDGERQVWESEDDDGGARVRCARACSTPN